MIVSTMMLGLLMVGVVGMFMASNVKAQAEESILIYGTMSGPVDMDIHNSWDTASSDVLDQIVETLITYDLSQLSIPLKPLLATSWSWNDNSTQLTMNLRSGVLFHDGNPFNASVVKWNIDRLYNLIDLGESQLGELYFMGDDPLISNVEVISNLVVRFDLVAPYSPFEGLLTFGGSGMISPASAANDTLLQYGNAGDKPIGTGPFMFENYTVDDNLQLKKFANYWGPKPGIDRVIYQIIEDANTRNTAMLDKEITFLADPLPELKAQFQNDSELFFQDGPKSLVIQYIGMNNILVNNTMRKAAAWAFNYTYALDEIMLGEGTRLRGPIPDGMRYYDGTVDYITQNVTMARQILIDEGLAPQAELNNDTWWTAKAQGANPIASYNYTFNTGNQKREEMGTLLKANLETIGVAMTINGTTWADFLYMLYDVYENGRNMLNFYFVGWGPDFNDPDNYITPLYSNTSGSNGAQVNDPTLQAKMLQAKASTVSTTRATLYSEIQDYLQNDLVPWIYVYQGKNLDVWQARLQGYHPNVLGRVYFGTSYFGTPGAAIPIPTMSIVIFVVAAASLLTILEGRRLKRKQ